MELNSIKNTVHKGYVIAKTQALTCLVLVPMSIEFQMETEIICQIGSVLRPCKLWLFHVVVIQRTA